MVVGEKCSLAKTPLFTGIQVQELNLIVPLSQQTTWKYPKPEFRVHKGFPDGFRREAQGFGCDCT